jgi:hypothetical protein
VQDIRGGGLIIKNFKDWLFRTLGKVGLTMQDIRESGLDYAGK